MKTSEEIKNQIRKLIRERDKMVSKHNHVKYWNLTTAAEWLSWVLRDSKN